jgi:hypothetical protein
MTAVELLEEYEAGLRAIVESHAFQVVLARSERLRLSEWGDITLIETDEAQEILNEAISPLAEYQARSWECRKCREGVQHGNR